MDTTHPHPTTPEITQGLALTAEEDRLIKMMKALGSPVRWQIMRYLMQHPQCITGDIVAFTPLAQATISQHLKVLREADLVCGTVEGPAVCYCVNEESVKWLREHLDLLLADACCG